MALPRTSTELAVSWDRQSQTHSKDPMMSLQNCVSWGDVSYLGVLHDLLWSYDMITRLSTFFQCDFLHLHLLSLLHSCSWPSSMHSTLSGHPTLLAKTAAVSLATIASATSKENQCSPHQPFFAASLLHVREGQKSQCWTPMACVHEASLGVERLCFGVVGIHLKAGCPKQNVFKMWWNSPAHTSGDLFFRILPVFKLPTKSFQSCPIYVWLLVANGS